MKIGDTIFVIVNNETRELVPFDGDTRHFDTDRKSCEDVMHEIDAAETSSVVECVFVKSSEVARLRKCEAVLHQHQMHPDYEYETTDGPRKNFDQEPPSGEGWIRNIHCGRDGWERFDYHEEAYWMRLKPASLTPSGDGETEK